MAKLRADKRNYKKAFTVHANSYDNWNIGSPYSRRLLLCYCVECGLKCLIMENDNIYTISQADDETAKILQSEKSFADTSGEWNLILVDRNHYIPDNYQVELTELSNGKKVDSRI